MLTNYNGTSITYDASGNPTKWKNASNLYWKGGRLTLVSLEGTNANEVSFSYNSAGIRTKKHFAGGAGMVPYYTDVYTVDGSRILSEVRTDDQLYTVVRTLYYIYDASGSVIGMEYNGAKYWYDKNLQGDIVGIRNSTGTLVAQYVYDAWGKNLQITDKDGNDVSGNPDHIANINPFRYRGYYYDVETGWYYLNARYYDPNVGRFLSPDVILGANGGLQGYNLFAYCNNNPVMFADPSGNFAIFGGLVLGKAAAAVAGAVATVFVTLGSVILSGRAEQVGSGVIDGVSDLWNKIKDLFASKEEDKVVDLAPDVAKTEENSPSTEVTNYQVAYRQNKEVIVGDYITFQEAAARVSSGLDVMCSDSVSAFSLTKGYDYVNYEIDKGKTVLDGYYYHFHISNTNVNPHGSPHIWHYGAGNPTYLQGLGNG